MQHYHTINPNSEWAPGGVWQLVRWRWLLSAIGVDGLATIALFFYEFWQLGVVAFTIGIGMSGTGFMARHFLLQRLKLEETLHRFLHECRDLINDIIGDDGGRVEILVNNFHSKVTEYVARYFRVRTGTDDIGSAMRLAEPVDGEDCYVTKARHGLSPEREKNTEPLPSNCGLASALREKGTQGVYVVGDLTKAAQEGGWMKTKNDELGDICTLMAAPINGWDDGRKSMFGILYVTSRSHRFSASDTEALKAFADALGTHYAMIWYKLGPTT